MELNNRYNNLQNTNGNSQSKLPPIKTPQQSFTSNNEQLYQQSLNNYSNYQNSLSSQNIVQQNQQNQEYKMFFKNLLDNQNELNFKYKGVFATINELDNNGKLNNFKIQEIDQKLTDLLFNFTTFLKHNQIMTSKVEHIEHKLYQCADKQEVNKLIELNQFMSRDLETAKYEMKMQGDITHNRLSQLEKEFEIYQKFSLDKFDKLSKEIQEGNLIIEEQFKRAEKAINSKMENQVALIYEKFKTLEIDFMVERDLKTNLILNMKKDVDHDFLKQDQKLKELEKEVLTFESRFLNLSKEYMQQFELMISDFNIKFNAEIEKIKQFSIGLIEELEFKYREMSNSQNKQLESLSNSNTALFRNFEELDSANKNLNREFCNKFIEIESKINLSKEKEENNKEQLKNLEDLMVKKKEYTDTTEKNNNRLNDFEINLKYQNTLIDTKFDKKCKDISDLISLNDKKHKELLSDMKICVDKIINDHDVESEYIDKKINYKLEIFKTTLDDFKKKLIEKVDLDEEKLKNENKKDNFHILQTISVKLDEKLAVMKKDLSVEKDDYMKILEGKLHGLIIELEKRTDENVNFKLMNLEERLIKT